MQRAVVLFVHGSGSSRHSPRNQFVAERLRAHRLGTVLTDLMTPAEERADQFTGRLRFDIPFLAGRVIAVVDALRRQSKRPAGVVRRQHGRRSGARRGGCEAERRRSGGLARRPPRPGWRCSGRGAIADALHCRQRRPRGARTEPQGDGAHERRRAPRSRPSRLASVSRARRARNGGGSGRRMVRDQFGERR